MKILDRYIASRFIRTFIFSLLALVLLPVLVDIIEHVDYFVDRKAGFLIVAQYYWYSLPYFLTLVIPVAALLSTLFSLGILSKNNELTAMRASGVSLYRLLLPIWAVSILIALLAFFNEEYLKPPFTLYKNRLKTEQIEKSKQEEREQFYNVYAQGSMGWIYHLNIYDKTRNTGFQVVLQRFQGDKLVEQLEAQRMIWKDPVWVLEEGRYRLFLNDTLSNQDQRVEEFQRIVRFDLRAKPELFVKREKQFDQMSLRELLESIDLKRKSGQEISKEIVRMYMKISLPFASFVIVLFGAPLAALPRRSGLAFGFGVTLIISFVYYVLIQLGQTLGYNQKLPPLLAAWLGNLVFGIAGLLILFRVRK